MNRALGDPRVWLEAEYLERRQRNPAYSLRAFAKLLDLPSGRVSQLLSQKRPFTKNLGQRIALRLNYDPVKTHRLLTAIQTTRAGRRIRPSQEKYRALDMDEFQLIADPNHFAILSLVETENFQGGEKEAAAHFGISRIEARAAIERLIRIGLLKKKGKRIALASSPGLATTSDIRSAALRESHKKVLDHARESIDSVALELRDITSMTMAIDPSRLPEAKEKIKLMRRSLSEFLEKGHRTDVYRLNIQLVPVTKKGKKR
jgi:uncharacterized protein (TIGR02147 family)